MHETGRESEQQSQIMLPLHEQQYFHEFTDWFKNHILAKPPTPALEKGFYTFGLFDGVLASALAMKLSYDFGYDLAANNSTQNGKITLGVFTALISVIPNALLNALVAAQYRSKLVHTKTTDERNILEPTHCFKMSYFIGLSTIAMLASLPESYINKVQLSEIIGDWSWWCAISSFMSLALVGIWAMNHQILTTKTELYPSLLRCVTKEEITTIHHMRREIIRNLNKMAENIELMSSSEIDNIYSLLFATDSDDDLRIRLKTLLVPDARCGLQTKSARYLKNASAFLGTLIGFAAPYVSLTLGASAGKAIADFMGIDDEKTTYGMSETLSLVAFFSYACLYSYVTKKNFEKTFLHIHHVASKNGPSIQWRSKETLMTIAQIIFSLGSVIPTQKLIIEYTDYQNTFSYFLMSCALIGPFSVNFWAIQKTIDDKVQHNNKNILLGTIEMLQDTVLNMKDRHVRALHEEIVKPSTNIRSVYVSY